MANECHMRGAGTCSLSTEELCDRLAWIAKINAAGLRSHRRCADRVELVYEPEVADRVRELVRRERACCGLLEFDLREAPDAVIVTVAGPADAAERIVAVLTGGGGARPGGGKRCSS